MSVVDIHGIVNCLPHRYPFLLLDRVLARELEHFGVQLLRERGRIKRIPLAHEVK